MNCLQSLHRIGIKVISELKKENRLKFIILSVAVAELSLVLFGALQMCIRDRLLSVQKSITIRSGGNTLNSATDL